MSDTIARLISHPDTTCNAIRSISVNVNRDDHSSLSLRYCLEGDISSVLVPTASQQHRANGLWQQTCFEAFTKPKSSNDYCEFNFSPSTAWAAYRFEDYRKGMIELEVPFPPDISISKNDRSLIADVAIDLKSIIDPEKTETMLLALAVVVKTVGNCMSYWALTHPPGKPDFHHRDSFLITL